LNFERLLASATSARPGTGAYFSLAHFICALLTVLLLREPVTWQLLMAGMLMGYG